MAETTNNKKISQLNIVNNWYDLKQSDIIPIVASNTTSQVSMSKFVQYVTQWSAKTGSNSFIGNQSVTGNVSVSNDLTIGGTLTVKKMLVDVTSASVIYQDGSTKFGDTINDTHEYTGSVKISGSLSILGANIGNILYAYTSSTNAIQSYTSSLKSAITVTGTDVSVAGSVTASNLLVTGSSSLGNDSTDVTTITGKLVVTNGITGSLQNGIYKGGNTEGSAFSIGSNDNYAISLKTNNTDRVYINSTGNIGIGTTNTSPARLNISGSTARSLLLQSYTSSGYNYVEFWDNSGQRTSYIGHGSSNNDFYYYLTGSDDSHVFYTSASQRVIITETGNVGIGTMTPSSRLHIADGNQRIVFLSGSNTSGYTLNIGINDDGVNFINGSNSRGFNFGNTNGTILTVGKDSSTNVGIGTTSPSQKLEVNGGILISSSAYVENGLERPSASRMSFGITSVSSTGNIFVKSLNNSYLPILDFKLIQSGAVASTTPHLRISDNGIGVNTQNPSASIDILKNDGSVPALRIKSGDTGATLNILMNTDGNGIVFNSSNLGGSITQPIDFKINNSSKLKITTSGVVEVSGSTYLQSGLRMAYREVSTTTTLTTSDTYVVTTTSTTLTLPAAASAGSGFTLYIKNAGATSTTVNRSGASSDTIDDGTTTSISIASTNTTTLVSNGTNRWYIFYS